MMTLDDVEVTTLFTVLESSVKQCSEWLKNNPDHAAAYIVKDTHKRREALFKRVSEATAALRAEKASFYDIE